MKQIFYKKRLIKLKILLILITINTQLFSQHSFEYFHSNDEDLVSFIETTDNKLAFLMDDSLFLFNQEGDILEKRKILDKNYQIRKIIKGTNGGYIATGLYDTTGEQDYLLWFRKFDENFNTALETTTIDFSPKKYFLTWDCVQNYNNDIILVIDNGVTYYGGDSCFLYQLNETGNIIREKKFADHNALRFGKIVQIPDTSGYFFANFNTSVSDDGTDCIFRLDNEFNIDTVYNTYISDNLEYQRSPNIKFLTDTTFIYAGECYYKKSAISLYDTTFNEIKNIIFASEQDFNKVASHNALDWVDTSAIYFTFLDPGLHYYPPVELNYSVIIKYNSNLDILWEKFYGDSLTKSMNLKKIHATNDGGCIITGDIQFTPFDEWDVKTFIVKVDADGNLPASIKEPKIKAHELILYPNPGSKILNIRTAVQRIGGEFKMYDISGKLVFQQNIKESITTISTELLPSGAYVYNYIHEGEVIESGKWVKK